MYSLRRYVPFFKPSDEREVRNAVNMVKLFFMLSRCCILLLRRIKGIDYKSGTIISIHSRNNILSL